MKIDDFRELSKQSWNQNEDSHRKIMEYLTGIGIDPGNFYQELEMSSPYVNTHRDITYYNVPVNLHSHSYYEIIYCHRASGVEYLIGVNRYRLKKGDILFVPPGVSHRPILAENIPEPYERDVIWISQEFMNSIGNIFISEKDHTLDYTTPIRTKGTRWEFLGELFRSGVLEDETRRPGWEMAVIGNTLTVLANMKRAYAERSAGTMKAEKPELLDRITAFIEQNYGTRITVEELARKFYVSSSSVSHLFKQKLGVSVYSYITQRRLIAAKELIAQNESLEAVAEQVGFSDYSTFYRAFKQEFGISPKQYRQHQT